jgi:adenylosuccinate lyase
MATENILMDAVKKGGNRQELHERLRVLSMEAARNVKIEGLENDLISRIANDGAFNLDDGDVEGILNPQSFIGRSQQQVEEYLKQLT